MIHAITWALVPMSGAGMSRLGPDHVLDPLDELPREQRSARVALSVAGSQSMPPLAPPNGTSTTAVFQVISVASAVDLVLVDARVVTQTPLHGPASPIVLDAVAQEVEQVAAVALDDQFDLHHSEWRQ